MNIQAALGLAMMAVVAACLATWATIAARLAAGKPLLPAAPRRTVPWTGLGVVIAVFLYLAFTVAGAQLARYLALFLPAGEQHEAQRMAIALAATGIATLCSVLCSWFLIRELWAARAEDFGFGKKHLAGDIGLGVLAFLAVAPPTYLLQSLLSMLDDTAHPIIDLLKEFQNGATFAAAAFTAVVAAPIVEEFLFRAVLQGWLERRLGVRGPVPESVPQSSEDAEPFAPVELVASTPSENPFAPPLDQSEADTPPADEISPVESSSNNWWRGAAAIVISSTVFAAMHYGQGLAPISLFFLALALGYLYQRTHRIWPCIVVHMLVNGTSMMLLWLILRFDLMPK